MREADFARWRTRPAVVTASGLYLLPEGITHFGRSETACRCGCGLWQVSEAVIRIAQALRDLFGRIDVRSGVRCKNHNRHVGGASSSKHLPDAAGLGHALDLRSPATPPARMALEARALCRTGGVGLYHWGIHVDDRPERMEWFGWPDPEAGPSRVVSLIASLATERIDTET